MKKMYYNIYMECVKEASIVTARKGDIECIGKIKSEGLAYETCKAIQETAKPYFKVYYK